MDSSTPSLLERLHLQLNQVNANLKAGGRTHSLYKLLAHNSGTCTCMPFFYRRRNGAIIVKVLCAICSVHRNVNKSMRRCVGIPPTHATVGGSPELGAVAEYVVLRMFSDDWPHTYLHLTAGMLRYMLYFLFVSHQSPVFKERWTALGRVLTPLTESRGSFFPHE